MTNDVLDYFGNEIKVGSRVLYTTNAESSGLKYGEVIQINQKPVYGHGRVPTSGFSTKIRLHRLENDGSVSEQTEWDSMSKSRVPIGKPRVTGLIDYASYKFFVLTP